MQKCRSAGVAYDHFAHPPCKIKQFDLERCSPLATTPPFQSLASSLLALSLEPRLRSFDPPPGQAVESEVLHFQRMTVGSQLFGEKGCHGKKDLARRVLEGKCSTTRALAGVIEHVDEPGTFRFRQDSQQSNNEGLYTK